MQELDEELLSSMKPKVDGLIAELKEFIYRNFDQFDVNGDGFLSREELQAALVQPGRTQREAAFLNFLLVRIRAISSSYGEEWADRPDSISKVDLQEYFAKIHEPE